MNVIRTRYFLTFLKSSTSKMLYRIDTKVEFVYMFATGDKKGHAEFLHDLSDLRLQT